MGLLFCSYASSQDIHFSQIFENPLSLNPALSGSFYGDYSAEVNYKNQWNSAAQNGNGYHTTAATIEMQNIFKHSSSSYFSPALSVFEDKSGDAHISQFEANLTLASGVFINDNSCFAAGLQGGYSQNSISLSGIQWNSQYINGAYDPTAPTGESSLGNSFSYADFSAGMAYYYGAGQENMTSNDALKGSAGVAIFHVSHPSTSYFGQSFPGSQLYMKYTGFANMEIGIPDSKITAFPSIVYLQQGPAWEFDAGAKIRYELTAKSQYTGNNKGSALDLGAYYRVGDAATFLAGYEWNNFVLGCSYDFNLSSLTPATHTAGGFEISLRFINFNTNIREGDAAVAHRLMFMN